MSVPRRGRGWVQVPPGSTRRRRARKRGRASAAATRRPTDPRAAASAAAAPRPAARGCGGAGATHPGGPDLARRGAGAGARAPGGAPRLPRGACHRPRPVRWQSLAPARDCCNGRDRPWGPLVHVSETGPELGRHARIFPEPVQLPGSKIRIRKAGPEKSLFPA